MTQAFEEIVASDHAAALSFPECLGLLLDRETTYRYDRKLRARLRYARLRSAYRGVDRYVYERVRDFLARRHKVAGRGTRRFSCEVVYGDRGLLRLERLPLTAPACASQ
jgi:hypothetical protein